MEMMEPTAKCNLVAVDSAATTTTAMAMAALRRGKSYRCQDDGEDELRLDCPCTKPACNQQIRYDDPAVCMSVKSVKIRQVRKP